METSTNAKAPDKIKVMELFIRQCAVAAIQCAVTIKSIDHENGHSLPAMLAQRMADNAWHAYGCALNTRDVRELDFIAHSAGNLVTATQDILFTFLTGRTPNEAYCA